MRYPTLPAGQIRGYGLTSFLGAEEDQDNSTHQRQATEYGGNGNMVLFVRSGMDRANIKNLFPMGVGETLIGEGQAAQDNQENSHPYDRFHILGLRNYTLRLRP